MQGISNRMLEFKDAIRHVWNTYFAGCDSPMDPEIQSAFERIELGLLLALVLLPLGKAEAIDQYRRKALPFLLVRPAVRLRDVPLQVGERDANGNMSWGTPISISTGDQVFFEFFDYFDWFPYGYIDLPYVRVRVASSAPQPELRGAMVLIEQVHCRFGFVDADGLAIEV